MKIYENNSRIQNSTPEETSIKLQEFEALLTEFASIQLWHDGYFRENICIAMAQNIMHLMLKLCSSKFTPGIPHTLRFEILILKPVRTILTKELFSNWNNRLEYISTINHIKNSVHVLYYETSYVFLNNSNKKISRRERASATMFLIVTLKTFDREIRK